MLELRGISKSFERPVLAGVDLAVDRGASVALLGESGSGKSTLLRIIAGLERADAGSVLIDGLDVADVAPHRRGVGFMFQSPALFPHRDVAGNIGFGLRMQRWPADESTERIRELLDLVGLSAAGHRDVTSLSGGEAQRVALARALAPRPSALLLDEPFGALDRARRDDLVVEVRDILDELDVTVISVTHDAVEAAAFAQDIAVLLGGHIVQRAPARDVVARPLNEEVARLIGRANH